eukprot:scaffold22435_cov120-Isochrysis_galbana.AAC.4
MPTSFMPYTYKYLNLSIKEGTTRYYTYVGVRTSNDRRPEDGRRPSVRACSSAIGPRPSLLSGLCPPRTLTLAGARLSSFVYSYSSCARPCRRADAKPLPLPRSTTPDTHRHLKSPLAVFLGLWHAEAPCDATHQAYTRTPQHNSLNTPPYVHTPFLDAQRQSA